MPWSESTPTKTRVITIILVLGLFAGGVAAFIDTGGPEAVEPGKTSVRWFAFDEGFSLAKQTNRKLLIDVYTDWCSWCKKMDKEVYTDPRVQEVLQARFVPVKLDAESSRELTLNNRTLSESRLAQEMGVTGYPTTVFFDSNVQFITKVAGYVESAQFARILRFIGEDHYRSKTFEEFLSIEDASDSQ